MKKNIIKIKIKKVTMNKYLRAALFILSIVIFISMIGLLLITEKYHKYTEKKYPIYSYTNRAKGSYEVFLIPNEIFAQKSLGEGSIYITGLVDYIKTNYKYEFNGEKTCDIAGQYNVMAILEGYVPTDSGDKTLWQKKYELLPATNFNVNNKDMSIEKEIQINIKEYMDFAKKVAEQLKITFLSKLTIKWSISPQIKIGNKTANESITIIMEIPIENSYFEIKEDLKQEKKGIIEETKKIMSPSYNSKMVIYYATLGLCVVFLIFLIAFTANSAALSPLAKRRKKIFKEHGDRMVAVTGEFVDISKVIIEVLSIEDLVKIADDIGRPIFYINSVNLEDTNIFYIVDDSHIYTLDIRKLDFNIPPEISLEEIRVSLE